MTPFPGGKAVGTFSLLLRRTSLTWFAEDKKRKAASPDGAQGAIQKKRRSTEGSVEKGAGGDQVDMGFDYGDFGGGDVEVRESVAPKVVEPF